MEVKGSLRRDGFTVEADSLTIHQRGIGKGDILIPLKEITHVEVKSVASPFVFLGGPFRQNRTLHLRVGGKKYVIRRLTKEEAQEAAKALMGR